MLTPHSPYRNYALNIPVTGKDTFPSQCTSSLTSGQTLIYESTTPSGSWGVATSTVPASTAASTGPTIVFGMHVNGFNVISTSTSSTAAVSVSGITTNSISTSQTSSAPTNTSTGSGSLSKGAAAGIGISVACLAVAALIGAWFFVRRGRRAKKKQEYVAGSGPYEVDSSNQIRPGLYEVDSSNPIVKPRIQSAHEMYAT